jgi:hypothetical protein
LWWEGNNKLRGVSTDIEKVRLVSEIISFFLNKSISSSELLAGNNG